MLDNGQPQRSKDTQGARGRALEAGRWGLARRKRRDRGTNGVPHGSLKRTSQVVLGIGVGSRKLWTGQTENGLHPFRWHAACQQCLGDPKVSDAPIGVRKALWNLEMLQPGLIASDGVAGGERLMADTLRVWHRTYLRRGNPMASDRSKSYLGGGSFHQRMTGRSKSSLGILELDPGSPSIRQSSPRLLVGESCQPSHMAPVGARPVALVETRQVPSDLSCRRRRQRLFGDSNPSLKMTWTGFDHDAGFMAMGAHRGENHWRRVIQVDQNVAGVLIDAIGTEIDVKALAVAGTEEPHRRRIQKPGRGPEPFAGKRPSGLVMNQADQVRSARHGSKLLADGPQRKRKSVIEHVHGLILNINHRSVELKSLNGQLYNPVVSQNPSQSNDIHNLCSVHKYAQRQTASRTKLAPIPNK